MQTNQTVTRISFVRATELCTLYLSNHSNPKHAHFFWVLLFPSLSSGWATTTSRLLRSNGKLARNVLSQGHHDAIPDRKSKRVSSTYRSPISRLTIYKNERIKIWAVQQLQRFYAVGQACKLCGPQGACGPQSLLLRPSKWLHAERSQA